MDAQYRALPADACVTAELAPFVALYDRRSGITHLLVEPAPQLLALLAGEPLTLVALRARLEQSFDLSDASDEALTARLGELIEAGLVAAG